MELGADTTICPATSFELAVDPQRATMQWNTGHTGHTLTIAEAGTYSVVLNTQGCLTSDSLHVLVTPLAHPELGNDIRVCEDRTVELRLDSTAARITWSTGDSTHILTVDSSGIYRVQVEMDGCILRDSVTVELRPILRQVPIPARVPICLGTPIRLETGIANGDHAWSTGASDAAITVIQPGDYTVQVTGDCIDAYAEIAVVEGNCPPFVHIPNAFSPNGDGMNEAFLPVLSRAADRYALDIFDRWGNRLFDSNDPLRGWDGTINGRQAPPGVYVWQLRIDQLGDAGAWSEELRGHVTLLR